MYTPPMAQVQSQRQARGAVFAWGIQSEMTTRHTIPFLRNRALNLRHVRLEESKRGQARRANPGCCKRYRLYLSQATQAPTYAMNAASHPRPSPRRSWQKSGLRKLKKPRLCRGFFT